MMKLTLPTSWVQGFISSNQSTLKSAVNWPNKTAGLEKLTVKPLEP